MSEETRSNLLFLNRHFKKSSKSDKSKKKAEFKGPKMKPMRSFQLLKPYPKEGYLRIE